MDIILLQKVRNLGDIGEQVKVRSGYGRNFLIPKGIALTATEDNRRVFEGRKAELLAASEDRQARARGRAEALDGRSFTLPMRASEEGKLYGSVGPQEIAAKIVEEGHDLDASEVILGDGAIRQIGRYVATLSLHAEVQAEIEVVVAQLTDNGVIMPPENAEPAAAGESGEVPEAAADAFEADEADYDVDYDAGDDGADDEGERAER